MEVVKGKAFFVYFGNKLVGACRHMLVLEVSHLKRLICLLVEVCKFKVDCQLFVEVKKQRKNSLIFSFLFGSHLDAESIKELDGSSCQLII